MASLKEDEVSTGSTTATTVPLMKFEGTNFNLGSSVSPSISNSISSISTISERRMEQYKSKGESDQTKRRRELLEQQKLARKNLTDRFRKLAENQHHDDEDEEDDEEEEERVEVSPVMTSRKRQLGDTMDTPSDSNIEHQPPQSKQRRTQKKRGVFNNMKGKYKRLYSELLLLMPEPLLEVPSDLWTDWILVPIPAGQRCIVISSQRTTVARLPNGVLLHRFQSHLPGGNSSKGGGGRGRGEGGSGGWGGACSGGGEDVTILDCIFSESSKTFYVLDLMTWRGYDHYECETAFRFYWLNTKLGEVNVSQPHPISNPFPFVPLKTSLCTPESLPSACQLVLSSTSSPLTSTSSSPAGYASSSSSSSFPPTTTPSLWFYNKDAHYVLGSTPLVCSLDLNSIPNFLDTIFTGRSPFQSQSQPL